jgi:hypothetical protein
MIAAHSQELGIKSVAAQWVAANRLPVAIDVAVLADVFYISEVTANAFQT